MATLTEIAKQTGVSPSTVSRVLNGSQTALPIAEKTRKRVLDAAMELGYLPSSAARALRRGKSSTIGVLGTSPDFFASQTVFASEILRNLLRGATEQGYHLTLLTGATADTGPYGLLADLGISDGVLILNRDLKNNPYLANLEQFPKPIVYVFDYPDVPNISAVGPDDIASGRLVMSECLKLGHRKIAFLQRDYFLGIFNKRADGMREEIVKWGGSPDDLIVETPSSCTPRELMERGVTAVIAGNDAIASEFLAQVKEQKLSIPDDLSFIHYTFSNSTHAKSPDFATISQPIHTVIDKALEHLITRITAPETPPAITLIPHTFISGTSLKKLKT